ncbi:MAG TPA: AMP-binding protein [Casimicrobiaceae bacterium]|nr:AMP-binding protein [Casimicrobiaceae bacterium]
MTADRGELTVGSVPRHYARIEPGKRALYDDERSLTYAELDDRVDRLASALVRDGIERGDVVCAHLPNSIDYVIVVLAVARAGAIFSPINPRYKASEVAPILAIARPRVLFTTNLLAPVAHEAAQGTSARIVAIDGNDADSLPALLRETARALPVVSESDCFSLMFTSGTTGEPKGAMATHRARMLWVLNATIQYGLNEADVYLGTMPQVHSAGLTFTLMHLYAGATVRIMPHFDAARFLDIVERERITSALTVPTMLTIIVEAIDAAPAPRSLASLARLVTCGSPLPVATKRRVIEKITPQLYDYYGSTESNSMTVLRPVDQLRKPGSVGQAFRNVELMIADANGKPCAANGVGEVWCANPSIFAQYRDRPDDTARAFAGRWYRTGDLGYLDDDGFLHLVGRKNDVLKSGGVNVYPAEIERVLMLHPSILDAAVVGVPDDKWGQSVKAFVVVRNGAPIDLAAVQKHCERYLADYKKPRSVEIVAALPKNAGGKTMKRALPGNRHG